jgi:hypothetical protein
MRVSGERNTTPESNFVKFGPYTSNFVKFAPYAKSVDFWHHPVLTSRCERR